MNSLPPDAGEVQRLIEAALDLKSRRMPRTVLSKEGHIGPSDIGFCRQAATLKLRGVEPSDYVPTRPADLGASWHTWVEDALTIYPDWLTEPQPVTATFRTGTRTFEVTGTPDIVAKDLNAILDIKTVDGYSWIKREGTSQNHKMQRYCYVKGAVAAGLLDGSKPLYVGNVYFDRSGRERECYVPEIVEPEPWLEDEIGQWLEDVAYAIETGEDASRDITAPVCAQICEFFTVCRGHLPDENAEIITEPSLIGAAQMYRDGLALEKEAKRMKDEAKAMLDGHSGLAGDLQVRWTNVPSSDVPGFTRSGYSRIDVSPVRRKV